MHLFIFAGRTSSNLTLDSIDDFTRYSDDGLIDRGDDKVAGFVQVF